MTNQPNEKKRPTEEPKPEPSIPEREIPDSPRRGSEPLTPGRDDKGLNPNDIFPVEGGDKK
ncbi:MAG: hypothetical protein WC831_01675 [Parcubacteria group bacterium]|jgi:hypothetical protein